MNDVETGYEEAIEAALADMGYPPDTPAGTVIRKQLRRTIEAAAPLIEKAERGRVELELMDARTSVEAWKRHAEAAEEKVKRELLERLSTPAAVDAFHAALPGPQRYSVVDTIAALRAAYEASTTQPLAGADDER